MAVKILPDVAELQRCLHYDPETGKLTWKVRRQKVQLGAEAGYITPQGYIRVTLAGQRHFAHRLIWCLVYGGCPPDLEIDHINGDGTDNRLCNLRFASRSQNMANRGPQKNNKCRFKGVFRHGKRWRACIQVCGQKQHLGCFDSPTLAHQAYLRAAKELCGEFARG